jgi:hypothetical protein
MHMSTGISVSGTATIGNSTSQQWISDWIDEFITNVATSTGFVGLMEELIEAMNMVAVPSDSHILHVASWLRPGNDGPSFPHLLVIGKDDSGRYVGKPCLSQQLPP